MKKLITYILILFCVNVFAQSNKERSYYFDTYQLRDIKDYQIGIFGKSHRFTNSKDDSYSMELKYEVNNNNTARILIQKNKTESIAFDLNFEYTQPSDLNKLKNAKLYTVVFVDKPKQHKNIVEEVVYETDSINNQIITNIKIFKNKKKRKIIREMYYFLSKNNSLIDDSPIKTMFTSEELKTLNEFNIDKIIQVNANNEKTAETTFLEYKKIDFMFTFKIDEVFPKTNAEPVTRW